MSRIDDLIKEKCPNGVEYKKVEDICYFQNGYAFKSNLFKNEGDILLRITNIDGKTIELSDVKYIDVNDYNVDLSPFKVYDDEIVIAMSGATTGKIGINHTGKVLYLNQRIGKFVPKNSKLNNHFLYHFLLSKSNYFYQLAGGGAQPNLSSDNIRRSLIPIPSIEVQEEIVRILDKFGELETELETELEARKSQYEFWRGRLLNEQYEVKYLPDLSTNLDSKRKPVIKGSREAGEYPYYGASGIVDYVSNYIFDDNLLLISEDGANLLARSTPIAFSSEGKVWVNNHAHVLKFDNKITQRYVEHYLNMIDLSEYITGAAQPKLNQDNLNKIKINIPSIKEQERIVNILDKFDKLANDISVGLPAEIEARRKQYEYYRNKLLSFEELTNE